MSKKKNIDLEEFFEKLIEVNNKKAYGVFEIKILAGLIVNIDFLERIRIKK